MFWRLLGQSVNVGLDREDNVLWEDKFFALLVLSSRRFSGFFLGFLGQTIDVAKGPPPPSSVARGAGGSSPLHWLVKYAKSHVFGALRPIFCEKLKIAPPPPQENSPPSNVWISDFGRNISLNFGEDLFFVFGRKKRLNFRAFREIPS